MFGYVVVNEQELKIREFNLYRSYYCGMCMDLKEHYGQTGRLTLSYDTVFLSLLLTGLYEPEEVKRSIRCFVHPFEKHASSQNEYTRYGSEKACALYPDKASVIREKLDELHALEKTAAGTDLTPAAVLDKAAGIFGELLAEVFDCRKDSWSPALRRVGHELGRYIYILDAYDDLEKDMRSGSFNPLIPMKDRPGFDQYVRGVLTMALSDCTAAFETLPVVENIDILRNILYSGIWCKFEEKHRKRSEAASSTERTVKDE